MSWLSEHMPDTQLTWSQVLPRIACPFSPDINVMERTHRRLHSATGSYLFTDSGGCIRYPHIIKSEQLLVSDGVHLTDVDNEVVLNILQGALVNLEEFLIFKDMPMPCFKSCCIQFQCNDDISHMHLLYELSLM
jgi:hypothetical protein